MPSTDPTAPATVPRPMIQPDPLGPAPGEGRRAGRGEITSYGTGRTCSTPGCTTILSRYNDTASCAGHSPLATAGGASLHVR